MKCSYVVLVMLFKQAAFSYLADAFYPNEIKSKQIAKSGRRHRQRSAKRRTVLVCSTITGPEVKGFACDISLCDLGTTRCHFSTERSGRDQNLEEGVHVGRCCWVDLSVGESQRLTLMQAVTEKSFSVDQIFDVLMHLSHKYIMHCKNKPLVDKSLVYITTLYSCSWITECMNHKIVLEFVH